MAEEGDTVEAAMEEEDIPVTVMGILTRTTMVMVLPSLMIIRKLESYLWIKR